MITHYTIALSVPLSLSLPLSGVKAKINESKADGEHNMLNKENKLCLIVESLVCGEKSSTASVM